MEAVSAAREIQGPLEQVFQHFVDPSEELRLHLHAEHVKAYKELARGDDFLEYEFTFQSYGFRFWGKAREEFERPHHTRIYIQGGVLEGAQIDLHFTDTGRGTTRVEQITRMPERTAGPLKRLFRAKQTARIQALAAVHLDQHGRDIEGLERKRYVTSGEAKAAAAMDFLRLVRAISTPMIVVPMLCGAALAAADGSFSLWRFVLTTLGGVFALYAGNLTNDIWDFQGGADHATMGSDTSTMTSSGVLLFGKLTLRAAWTLTAGFVLAAVACGAALSLDRPWVWAFALAGLGTALLYQAPPFKLAYRGYGLGELCILLDFGPLPVAGAYYAQTGRVTAEAWLLGLVCGVGAALVLYCHHFLHWQSDREAGKMSPIAVLGPHRGARLGLAAALAFAGLLAAGPWLFGAPKVAAALAAAMVLVLLVPAFWRAARQEPSVARAWRLLNSAGTAFVVGVSAVAVAVWTLRG